MLSSNEGLFNIYEPQAICESLKLLTGRKGDIEAIFHPRLPGDVNRLELSPITHLLGLQKPGPIKRRGRRKEITTKPHKQFTQTNKSSEFGMCGTLQHDTITHNSFLS